MASAQTIQELKASGKLDVSPTFKGFLPLILIFALVFFLILKK